MVTRRALLVTAVAGGTIGPNGCLGRSREKKEPPSDTRFDFGCPPVEIQYDRAVCSHTVDRDDAAVYLAPETPTTSRPHELRLTLYNQTDQQLRFNPHSWTIWKRREDEWRELEPITHADGLLELDAGDSHSWRFGSIMDYYTEPYDARYSFDDAVYLAGIPTSYTTKGIIGGEVWQQNIAAIAVERREG